MHTHRLNRLAKLTRGVALVGVGATFACHDQPATMNGPDPNPTHEPIHVNAPAPQPSAPPSASAAPGDR